MSVIPGQDRGQMGEGGTIEVETFIATNSRAFLDAYLRGGTACACAIGSLAPIARVDNRRKAAAAGSLLAACPR